MSKFVNALLETLFVAVIVYFAMIVIPTDDVLILSLLISALTSFLHYVSPLSKMGS